MPPHAIARRTIVLPRVRPLWSPRGRPQLGFPAAMRLARRAVGRGAALAAMLALASAGGRAGCPQGRGAGHRREQVRDAGGAGQSAAGRARYRRSAGRSRLRCRPRAQCRCRSELREAIEEFIEDAAGCRCGAGLLFRPRHRSGRARTIWCRSMRMFDSPEAAGEALVAGAADARASWPRPCR